MPINVNNIEAGKYYIVDVDGTIYTPDEYKFTDSNFKSLVDKEVYRKESKYKESPHVRYLKKLKLADNEPYTDAGHLSYLPRGALILDLLMDYSLSVVVKLGAMPVHTSIMYDLNIPPIQEHAKLFGQRMYKVKPVKREFILRYAACFGQFALLRRKYLSSGDFPLRMYEMADSYRYEQRGEISGLARVRRFYMPDMHILTKDLSEAEEEFKNIYKLILDEGSKFGWNYYSLYNVTLDFVSEGWDFINDLLKIENKPILLYGVEPNKYYWVINIEFHYIDSMGRPLETATVQIDVGNSRRFNIKYVDENGNKKYPVIIHTAIHGSLERLLFEFLEEAAKMEDRNKKPMLPIWLSPIQVRVIPISKRNMEYAEEVLDLIDSNGFRVDIDDRDATLARKIKDAESEWIPYILVVGDKEMNNRTVNVRIRNNGQKEYTINEFIKELEAKTIGYPRRPLYFNKYLSKRPVFI